jgi:hypothetical protein
MLGLAASAMSPAGAADDPIDLELVIAVDMSRSMDLDEVRLQRSGYVEAIRDPEFIAAATSGGTGRIALTFVEWSGQLHQKVVVPWKVIDGRQSAEAFASALAALPPEIGGGGTSISSAIGFASRLFDANDFDAERRVIDISGDGPNNYGPPVAEARDAAVAAGIVINGLPILLRPSPIVPDIARYYSDCVIGGPGSFVLPVRNASEFAEAIRRKLILEVAARSSPSIIPAAVDQPADCLIGEKTRSRFTDQYFPGLDR